MSSSQKLTKKQKKALAFREHKGKGKPKSFDELDNDVPVEENQDLAEAELDEEAAVVEDKKGRAAGTQKGGTKDEDAMAGDHKGKKRKWKGDDEAGGDGKDAKEENASKQTAKKKRKGVDGAQIDSEGDAKEDDHDKKAKQRYILFVGNLKYTTTKEAVEQHFSKCDPPPTVRLMKPKPSAISKPTAKSKGFAFVEFTHRNALQQGLKLHQSELEGRKINVELTAGGGGKSEHRLDKVKQRNKELHEQRKNQLLKRTPKKKQEDDGSRGDGEDEDIQLERPQRYSTTSGVDQVPLKSRTWSIPEAGDEVPGRKRGSKKGRKGLPKPLGTGVNAIPVG